MRPEGNPAICNVCVFGKKIVFSKSIASNLKWTVFILSKVRIEGNISVGCHNSLRPRVKSNCRHIATPTSWRCELRRLFNRKHTSTQLSDVLIRSINYIGWGYFEQINTNSLNLAKLKHIKTF